jgi:regulator of ribonuclease activity A
MPVCASRRNKAVKTADLVDAFDEKVRSCAIQFQMLGRRRAFSGQIATVKTFEDNALVRRCLEQPGHGRVLVVDGAGSLRVALVGDMVASLGMNNGWSGIVVYGAIRDAVEIDALEFGVFAIGRSPKKSGKRGSGEIEVALAFGDATFVPGQFIYCDEDGVLIAEEKLV